MYNNGKCISLNEMVKSDINSIEEAIKKCDTRLNYLRCCDILLLDDNTIESLEKNRNILSFKKYVIEKDMSDICSRSKVFNYYDSFGHLVYGYAYNDLNRSNNYRISNQLNLENLINSLILRYYYDFQFYKISKINRVNFNDIDYIEDEDVKNNLLLLEDNYLKIIDCNKNVLLVFETINDMVDDIINLNIDNLEEEVKNNHLFEIMSKNNIVKDTDKYSHQYEIVFNTIYEDMKEKQKRLGSWECLDFNLKNDSEKIIELFNDEGVSYIYDNDTINEISNIIEFINDNNHKTKSYK